jgi:hypothetical protein
MKMKQTDRNILKNQKGILTLDFIFASIMMFTFSAILFRFAITFVVVEITQYATFASARTYFAAHKNQDEQERIGKLKFDALLRDRNSVLGNFFRNDWFEVGNVEIADFSGEFSQTAGEDSDTFVGARTSLVAKVLSMNIPLLGSTTDDDLGTQVSSYLMREPTEQECQDFTVERFKQIKNLKDGFSASFVIDEAYAPTMDDGC